MEELQSQLDAMRDEAHRLEDECAARDAARRTLAAINLEHDDLRRDAISLEARLKAEAEKKAATDEQVRRFAAAADDERRTSSKKAAHSPTRLRKEIGQLRARHEGLARDLERVRDVSLPLKLESTVQQLQREALDLERRATQQKLERHKLQFRLDALMRTGVNDLLDEEALAAKERGQSEHLRRLEEMQWKGRKSGKETARKLAELDSELKRADRLLEAAALEFVERAMQRKLGDNGERTLSALLRKPSSETIIEKLRSYQARHTKLSDRGHKELLSKEAALTQKVAELQAKLRAQKEQLEQHHHKRATSSVGRRASNVDSTLPGEATSNVGKRASNVDSTLPGEATSNVGKRASNVDSTPPASPLGSSPLASFSSPPSAASVTPVASRPEGEAFAAAASTAPASAAATPATLARTVPPEASASDASDTMSQGGISPILKAAARRSIFARRLSRRSSSVVPSPEWRRSNSVVPTSVGDSPLAKPMLRSKSSLHAGAAGAPSIACTNAGSAVSSPPLAPTPPTSLAPRAAAADE